jgi:hypothetical protein
MCCLLAWASLIRVSQKQIYRISKYRTRGLNMQKKLMCLVALLVAAVVVVTAFIAATQYYNTNQSKGAIIGQLMPIGGPTPTPTPILENFQVNSFSVLYSADLPQIKVSDGMVSSVRSVGIDERIGYGSYTVNATLSFYPDTSTLPANSASGGPRQYNVSFHLSDFRNILYILNDMNNAPVDFQYRQGSRMETGIFKSFAAINAGSP